VSDVGQWQALDAAGTIHTATYTFTGGLTRTVLIQLGEGSFLAFSPGAALVESAPEALTPESELILLAPAAAHTMGLAPWKARFPKAVVVAAEAARPRVLKKSGVDAVEALAALEARLPAHIAVHVPPGCKLGEVWLSVAQGDRVMWVVCDAFVNPPELSEKFVLRTLQTLYRAGPGLEVTRLFPKMFKDSARFREWASERFSNGRKNVLVPCHGAIDDAPDFTERILDLIQRRF